MVNVKDNAAALLKKRKPGALDGKRIYMSSVTDPYQPVERQLELTRGLLRIMADRGDKPKLVVQTRSPDVVRDCDLFRRIEENGGRVQVNTTVTTDDEDIRRTFEPFCPANPKGLEAISEVQSSDLDTCITMTPLLLVSSPYAFADGLVATGSRSSSLSRYISSEANSGWHPRKSLRSDGRKAGLRQKIVQERIPGALPHGVRRAARYAVGIKRGQTGFEPPC